MKLQKIKAFTLVELIIVIVILSILATIGFMSFQGYISDARDSNRITSLKTIQSSLNIYKTKNQTLPLPDNYVNVVGISYQGNIGTGIINKLKLSGIFKDPKDSNYYTYSASKNLSKFQISSLLENNNKIIFSFNDYLNNKLLSNNNNLLNQVYADNTSRYTYTLGDRIGILLDTTTNTPVNELLNGTGILDLNTDSGSYTAVFTNDSTNSGTIIGSGTNLLTEINIIQNSCVLGSSVITNGQQINAYNTESVAYNQTCTPIVRSCNNGVLSGDTNYKYDTCSSSTALNCSVTTYNGYDIPSINHNSNQNITKNITGGIADITASCVNGVLTYGSENINCSSNYVLDGGICKEDLCTGSAPDFSISNGTQKYNNPWVHNTTAGICTYICQAGYYYNTNLCNAASIGNYVATSGLTNQTACNANDKYQDITGQTNCKNVSAGYYSTPVGNVAHTGQTQCEANNYCIGGVKTACTSGYSSPAGSSSARACVINQYTVTGTITNGNGATVNICGKTTTADTSGNFSVTANYGTNCNNLSITRTNYTCSVSTNGSSSITSNSAVAGTCSINCPSGYTLNVSRNRCERALNCVSGTNYNTSTNRCEQAAGSACLISGGAWNGSSCTIGSNYAATSVYIREPASGEYYVSNLSYHWYVSSYYRDGRYVELYFPNPFDGKYGIIDYPSFSVDYRTATSFSYGGWTYHRGVYVYGDEDSGKMYKVYRIKNTRDYTCPSGGTLSGNTCIKTSTVAASCSSGYTHDGAGKCYINSTCNSGGNLDTTNDICYTN